MTESVAIVDYGSGNLHSAAKAFERMGGDARIEVTSRAEKIAAADRIVLPGVGAFADCKAGLERVAGVRQALEEAVRRRGVPFLGICVGMQLMAEEGFENGRHRGFGWVQGRVERLAPAAEGFKIPHMGWNELTPTAAGRAHPVLADIADGDHVYFVHSYAMTGVDDGQLLAASDHGGAFTAIVGRDNMIGVQFHPEKSQKIGLALVANFLGWSP